MPLPVQTDTVQLTAKQARLTAESFILDQIGDQVLAGEPWLIRSVLGSAWVTPMILTSSAYGPVGVVGALVVDETTGQVVASTPRDVLETKVAQLIEGHWSELEAAFWQAVTRERQVA